MLKIIILLMLTLNLAFAKTRFTAADKEQFISEINEIVKEAKAEGPIDFQQIKPDVAEFLEGLVSEYKITKDEMEVLKKNYDSFSKSHNPASSDEEFKKFAISQFDELNKIPLNKSKEGAICNNSPCEDGLVCHLSSMQTTDNVCKKMDVECKEDKDCCSRSCKPDTNSKKKKCEAVSVCYKPIEVGQSCLTNPVCSAGVCSAYNAKTLGIGECAEQNNSCKKNSDCCSNLCSSGKCAPNWICKDCAPMGSKAEGSKKCCEGLIKNEANVCIPDLPPVALPQVKNLPSKNILLQIVELFIPSAQAQVYTWISSQQQDAQANYDAKAAATVAAQKEVDTAQLEVSAAKAELADLGTNTSERLTNAQAKLDSANANLTAAKAAEASAKQQLETAKAESAKGATEKLSNDERAKQSAVNNSKAAEAAVKALSENIKIERRSDFTTCTMRFKEDFFNYLSVTKAPSGNMNLLDLELALLGFDFVLLGDSENDYWMESPGNPSTSINGRLKAIAQAHHEKRKEINKAFDYQNQRLKCMCLDVKGYKNITTEAQKAEFQRDCPTEYAKYADPATSLDELEGDSSGIKGKRLILSWTSTLQSFNMDLFVDNTDTYEKIAKVRDWVEQNQSNWNQGERKSVKLYSYKIKKPHWLAKLFGSKTKIHTAGLFSGPFSSKNTTSNNAIKSAITEITQGYPGQWVENSLRGAWLQGVPFLVDNKVSSKDCGPKLAKWLYKCESHDVFLDHPYNKICNSKTYANACIKHFLALYPDPDNYVGQPQYIVDPWVPWNVEKNYLLKNIEQNKNYVESLDHNWEIGKAYVTNGSTNPRMGANHYAQFGLRFSTPQNFVLTSEKIKHIKEKAREYAIDQQIFLQEDTKNLDAFADYAYEMHFVLPKVSVEAQISYPLVGLVPYLSFMAETVSGSLGGGAANAAKTFGGLHAKYLQDYINTLELYRDLPINQQDATKLKLINEEILKAHEELQQQNSFLSNLNNPKATGNLINAQAGSIGGNNRTSVGGLTVQQTNHLGAIDRYRAAKKKQDNKIAAYKKALANRKDGDRDAKVASAVGKHAVLVASVGKVSGLSGLSRGGSFSGGGTDGSNSNTDSSEGKKSDPSNNAGYANFNFGSVAGFGNTIDQGKRGNTANGSDAAASKGDAALAGVSEEDRRHLAEAIEARDSENKIRYQSNDDQSLFEKVTNAYIRNYDKVLIRRKDKEIKE